MKLCLLSLLRRPLRLAMLGLMFLPLLNPRTLWAKNCDVDFLNEFHDSLKAGLCLGDVLDADCWSYKKSSALALAPFFLLAGPKGWVGATAIAGGITASGVTERENFCEPDAAKIAKINNLRTINGIQCNQPHHKYMTLNLDLKIAGETMITKDGQDPDKVDEDEDSKTAQEEEVQELEEEEEEEKEIDEIRPVQLPPRATRTQSIEIANRNIEIAARNREIRAKNLEIRNRNLALAASNRLIRDRNRVTRANNAAIRMRIAEKRNAKAEERRRLAARSPSQVLADENKLHCRPVLALGCRVFDFLRLPEDKRKKLLCEDPNLLDYYRKLTAKFSQVMKTKSEITGLKCSADRKSFTMATREKASGAKLSYEVNLFDDGTFRNFHSKPRNPEDSEDFRIMTRMKRPVDRPTEDQGSCASKIQPGELTMEFAQSASGVSEYTRVGYVGRSAFNFFASCLTREKWEFAVGTFRNSESAKPIMRQLNLFKLWGDDARDCCLETDSAKHRECLKRFNSDPTAPTTPVTPTPGSPSTVN